MSWCGIEEKTDAIVVGARGGIGEAFVHALSETASIENIFALSRNVSWCSETHTPDKSSRVQVDILDEDSLSKFSAFLEARGSQPRFIINCSGLLHAKDSGPERRLSEIDLDFMRQVFDVNTLGVALLLKHLSPRLPRRGRSIFATLSARVGSIADNRLGGWYSYRASKAAQNMLVKTASIELARKYPDLTLVALHPGTVDSALSEPFTQRLRPEHRVFSPKESCAFLSKVLTALKPEDSGAHFAWDGSSIPW